MILKEEYELLNKIGAGDDKCFLNGHAIFALGIVTGNNRKYIFRSQKKEQQECVTEFVDAILAARSIDEIAYIYDKLDRLISDLYGLTDQDYQAFF